MTTHSERDRHNIETIAYYDGRIKKTMVPTGNRYTEHHLDKFIEITGIDRSQRILEVGCGMGRYTIPLAARGFQVEGLDLSPFLLDRLQEYNGGRFDIPVHCADIIEFPEVSGENYNAVIGFFALHHFHDFELCFSAMRKLVKPSGQIAFIEPNAYNILYYLQMLIVPTMTWKGDRGIAKMCPGVIFPAMRRAGLAPKPVYRFGFFPPFVANLSLGLKLEIWLEKFPLWKPLLPAVIFRGIRSD